jgi:hypothetical protein
MTAVKLRDRSAFPSRWVVQFARAVALLSVLGFVLQVLPQLNQVNADAIALALPLHVAVVVLLIEIKRRATRATAT